MVSFMIRFRATCLTLALALISPAFSLAQTPEQRYTDWADPTFATAEYERRRATALEHLAASGGGVLLIPSADGVTRGDTFRQLDDFLYFTGLELPASLLALDADAGTVTLFLPPRDPRFDNIGRPNDFPGRPLRDDPDVAALSGVNETLPTDSLGSALSAWARGGSRLLVNAGSSDSVGTPRPPLVGSLDPIESLVLRLRSDYADAEIASAFSLVARLRMRKSPAEVDVMRRAAEATALAIRAAAAEVRPGVDEATLQGVFEAACRREGASRIPFTPIVKSGPNSLWPWRILAAHSERRNRTLEAGDLVILDVGCEVDGYISDVGRSFPASGRFSDLQREKLEMITGVADAIIAAVRPGVRLTELTAVAYDAIPDDEEAHMQAPSYFGHHIGLSSGDPALFDDPLAPGMVFTVEPWYYNHRLGVSVFVEDVVLVTAEGAEVLTRSLPRSPEELERMVR
jgi:Xaa-Pro aminopeptidase